MYRKYLLIGFSCLVVLCCTIINVYLSNENNSLSVSSLIPEAFAGDDEEDNPGAGYDFNKQDCTVTETRPCNIELSFLKWECKFSFEYTVSFDGTEDPCNYTGNKEQHCVPFTCVKNG